MLRANCIGPDNESEYMLQFQKSHKEVGAKEGEKQQSSQMSTMDMLAGRPSPKFYEAVTVTE